LSRRWDGAKWDYSSPRFPSDSKTGAIVLSFRKYSTQQMVWFRAKDRYTAGGIA
jgi:hypothetical protein